MPLIEKTNGYELIYHWFDLLKSNGHFVNGFVVMPNHIHVIISFVNSDQSINTVIGNGKRFIAYKIIKRLKTAGEFELLNFLPSQVESKRKNNNKQHNVWELSFDWKECNNARFINQKLDYIHYNLCSGKWKLCTDPADYPHSSAKFYFDGMHASYPVTHFMEMEDINFEPKR